MPLSLPDVFEVLDTLATQIAEEIHTLFARITIPHYANLLNTLSWFMDGNDARALIDANQPQLPLGLREVLRRHGQDEGGHAVYALRDLAALGFQPTPQPPPAVRRVHRLVDRWDVAQKLGYSATVESMATQLGPSVLAMRDRLGLRDDHFRCIALHLEADAGSHGHAAQQRHAAQTYLHAPQWVAFLDGAFLGGRAWGAMIVDALRSPLYAPRPPFTAEKLSARSDSSTWDSAHVHGAA